MKEKLLEEIAAIDAQLAKGDEKLKSVYENMKADRVKQLKALGDETDVTVTVDRVQGGYVIDPDVINATVTIAEEIVVPRVEGDSLILDATKLEGVKEALQDDAYKVQTEVVYACSKCQRVCASGTGLSAHERKCKA